MPFSWEQIQERVIGKPSPPPAPDYAAAAKEQGIANKEGAVATASLGNPNVYSPYGNQIVTYDNSGPGGNAQPTITQSLTPAAQQTLDAQQRVQLGLANLGQQGLGTAQNILSTPFNYSGPDLQTSIDGSPQLSAGPNAQRSLDMSGVARMPVNAGMTGQQAIMNRLQPQIEQNQKATRQRLANQGLVAGGEAYDNEMRNQGVQENDLYSQAALQGIGLDMSANQQGYGQQLGQAGLYNSALGEDFSRGSAANAQNFNQNLQGAQFGNAAALQAYQQQLAQYNQPLNQISALMSGSQIQAPQFQQYAGANVQAAPIFQGAQAQDQAAQARYAQQMAGYNGLMGGIGSLGGGLLGGGLSAGGFLRGL